MTAFPLEAKKINAALTPEVACRVRLSVYDSVGSTNDMIKACGAQEDFHARVVLSEAQTEGRGRRGRVWHSPPGSNLYCSVGWAFELPLEALSGLSLALGAMVAEALASTYSVDLELKWPNDLYLDGRKLGGILIETTGERNGAQQVVIGLGLNVNMPADEGTSIGRPWTDLRSAVGQEIDRNKLTANVLNVIVPALQQSHQAGVVSWLDQWRQRDFLKGRSVTVDGFPPISGIAAGIDATGALLVDTADGIRTVAGGEVGLLSIEGAP